MTLLKFKKKEPLNVIIFSNIVNSKFILDMQTFIPIQTDVLYNSKVGSNRPYTTGRVTCRHTAGDDGNSFPMCFPRRATPDTIQWETQLVDLFRNRPPHVTSFPVSQVRH